MGKNDDIGPLTEKITAYLSDYSKRFAPTNISYDDSHLFSQLRNALAQCVNTQPSRTEDMNAEFHSQNVEHLEIIMRLVDQLGQSHKSALLKGEFKSDIQPYLRNYGLALREQLGIESGPLTYFSGRKGREKR